MRLALPILGIALGAAGCIAQGSSNSTQPTSSSGASRVPSLSASSSSTTSSTSTTTASSLRASVPGSSKTASSQTATSPATSASAISTSNSTSSSSSSSTSTSASLAVTTESVSSGAGLPGPNPTAVYTYSQPPLPSVTATRNPNAWVLSNKWNPRAKPTTREYTFDIAPAAAAPDGYPRQIYAVNNQFPGPLIEANEGDWVVVHVNNHLDIGQTIHWHGLLQNGTAYMDGIPGISQCPIPPGGSFTYKFQIKGQYGTYFWHSHFGNTMGDGLIGALIVHSKRDVLKRGRDFDSEVVVMISDWMDVQSQTIADGLHSATGYRGSFFAPQGNALTINGIGRTNCSNPDIQDHSLNCTAPALAEINVPAGKRTRLRLINAGSNGMYRVSVDQHPLEVIEVDETPVWGPEGLHEVPLTTGQRTSVVIDADQGEVGDGFYMRAYFVRACHGQTARRQEGLAIIRYVDHSGHSPNHNEPNSTVWPDIDPISAPCIDIDIEHPLEPREEVDAPTEILQTYVMSTEAGLFVDKNGVHIGNYGFNNVTYRNQIGYPLIQQVQDGHAIDGQYVAHSTFDQMGGGDIVINNLDAPGLNPILFEPISHPFHLHGKPFFIVARGNGTMTKEQWEASRDELAQTSNPLRRDVLEIPGGAWAVLRLYVDLPGVWALHCHVGWYLSDGKLAAFVYMPDQVKQLPKPADWSELCTHWGHDELGPARRDGSARVDGPQERSQPPGSTLKLGRPGPKHENVYGSVRARIVAQGSEEKHVRMPRKPPARIASEDGEDLRSNKPARRVADCLSRNTCADLDGH